MTLVVDVQYAVDATAEDGNSLPSPQAFERWVAAALAGRCAAGEMTIRVVDLTEGTALNEAYRHRNGPTNVLSFPYENTPEIEIPLLGDLVICAPVVMREAREQHKTPEAHWAHMTVHGSLHLLGYDHEEAREAEDMESLESAILTGLGYPDPYADEKEIRAAS
jgi:probable rRNA maturation factor